MGAEQSNTSVVLDERLALKVFRRIEPGINPELEMLRFLDRPRLPQHRARSTGWYDVRGRAARRDARRRAALHRRRHATAGSSRSTRSRGAAASEFLERLRRARRGHRAACTRRSRRDAERPGVRARGSHRGDARAADARRSTSRSSGRSSRPAGDRRARADRRPRRGGARPPAAALAPRRRRAADPHPRRLPPRPDRVRRRTAGRCSTSRASRGGRCRERRRKRSPLRDVAGMLRSFAYAASAGELLRGARRPRRTGSSRRASASSTATWQEVDPALLPAGEPGASTSCSRSSSWRRRVYELRYELDNRPDWVAVPVAAIVRLLEQPAA